MTPLEILCGPVCQRLAWTLLHFVWQGLLVAAGVAAIGWLFPLAQARSRYAVAVAGLLLMACCPPITFAVLEAAAPGQAAVAKADLPEAESASPDPVVVRSLEAPVAERPFPVSRSRPVSPSNSSSTV